MINRNSHSKITLISTIILSFLTLVSCNKKNLEIIEDTDIRTLPSMTVRNFSTQYSDSGRLNMVMSSPLMESYNEADPSYSEFPQGIEVIFYDGNNEPSATVNANYAKLNDNENLWELRDSVIIYSDNGTTLETEQLFWDQSDDVDKIYTDRFVKIISEDQTIMGHGFESDSRLTKRRIKKVTATIYITNEE